MGSTRLLTSLLLAFIFSSTAALADGCPGPALKMLRELGRQPQRDQIECHGNGGKGGSHILWVMVGNQAVGTCSPGGGGMKKWGSCQPLR